MILTINVHGGLGNRLFQISFLYTIAKRNGVRFHYAQWQKPSPHSRNVYEEVMHRFMSDPLYTDSIPPNAELLYCHEKEDEFMTFTDKWDQTIQDAKTRCKHNNQPIILSFHGYFQTERFFAPFVPELRCMLKEPASITAALHERYNHLLASLDGFVFLHVRLGDYVHGYIDKHFIDLNTYYARSIKDLATRAPGTKILLVCSDIPNLSKFYAPLLKVLEEQNDLATFLNEANELICLYLMSRCKMGAICSNSTFGWWASWLIPSENKLVYMPSRWIQGSYHHGIYPQNAIVIDTTDT